MHRSTKIKHAKVVRNK